MGCRRTRRGIRRIFVDLRLTNAHGQSLSNNFYWLSTRQDVLSDSSTWYMTPVNSYADYTQLRQMPAATVRAKARFTSGDGTGRATVTLTNPGPSIAFFIRLQVTGKNGDEALPVTWSDNYVSLLPGETRVLTASYRTGDLHRDRRKPSTRAGTSHGQLHISSK